MLKKGIISRYSYFDIPNLPQWKIDRAEKYANSKYEEHKKKKTSLYKEAHFEIWHNSFYLDLTKEEYENKVKSEFIFRYVKKMLWKEYWDKIK